MTLAEVLQTRGAILRNGGIEGSDIRRLAAHAFGLNSVEMISQSLMAISSEKLALLDGLVARRMVHEPIGRIVGIKEFYGLSFHLSAETLEPRADTECLVNAVVDDWQAKSGQLNNVLDLGTGTGAILIALLTQFPEWRGVGADVSAGAVETAQRNAQDNNVSDRARFMRTNWCAGIEGKFEVIVSNPPYINSDVIPTLSTEVKEHDPALALDGGLDGLDAYRQILDGCRPLLAEVGRLYLEIGYDQGDSVKQLAVALGWKFERKLKDYGENDRVLMFST